jgi:hypothetical protein
MYIHNNRLDKRKIDFLKEKGRRRRTELPPGDGIQMQKTPERLLQGLKKRRLGKRDT